MPNDDHDNTNDPIDLAAHRERRARQQQQRASARARRDADSPAADPNPDEVPCIRCNEPVYGHALRCPHCGVHFSGGADAFAPKEGLSLRTKMMVALVAVALLLAGLSDDIAAWW